MLRSGVGGRRQAPPTHPEVAPGSLGTCMFAGASGSFKLKVDAKSRWQADRKLPVPCSLNSVAFLLRPSVERNSEKKGKIKEGRF